MYVARRCWIAAVGALAVLLSATAAHAQNTKLLPNDTEMIISFNLSQILASDVAKSNKFLIDLVKTKVEEQLEDKGLAKHLKKANFDLFRDFSSITFAMPGGNRNPQDGFILIEGKFDAEKIEAMVTEASKDKESGASIKPITIGKVNAFEISPKEEKVMYVGVLDKKTMIACASKADFAEAVARLSNNKAAKFKSEAMKSLVSTLNSKQSISIAATSAVMTKLAENAPEGAGAGVDQAMAVLKQMDGVSAAITIQKDIDFQLGVNTKNAETASDYAGKGTKAIAGIKSKLSDLAKKDEKFAPAMEIVNTLKLTAQGTNLMVRGQITFDTLSQILQNLPFPKD